MSTVPIAVEGQRVVAGPDKVRNELRWQLALPDGQQAVLAQLLPEAARELSLRRRYVLESERQAALALPCIARTLAMGPQPDPRDPDAAPPWRLRLRPPGSTLAELISARAPLPVSEALELIARVADAVHLVHVAGVVLRDLEPRSLILGSGGAITLTDFGLARIDILSSHTASSVILEQSSYAAPEHLRQTAIDARADLYSLGVMLWQLLTGTLPFGSESAFFREHHALPALAGLCHGVPDGLDALIRSVLAESPTERPASARALAAMLRGEAEGREKSLARLQCQACLAPMRPGLRLCLACGKEAVQFLTVEAGAKKSMALELVKATEEETFHRKLRGHLGVIAERVPDNLNFIVGDARMYSKTERAKRIALPSVLLDALEPTTAKALATRLKADGLKVRLRPTKYPAKIRRRGKRIQLAGLGVAGVGVGLAVLASPAWLLLTVAGGITVLVGASRRSSARQLEKRGPALTQLRAAPAALPASDPLVARLAGLLAEVTDDTLREQVAEMALLVQRLCDHRAWLLERRADAGSLAMVTEPLEPLVGLIEAQVRTLIAVQGELAQLDEGAIVRAIASSKARSEPAAKREPLLEGLDRLRVLEESRSAGLQKLLEAGSLLEQIVIMGLRVDDPERLTENYTRLALAALGEGEA